MAGVDLLVESEVDVDRDFGRARKDNPVFKDERR